MVESENVWNRLYTKPKPSPNPTVERQSEAKTPAKNWGEKYRRMMERKERSEADRRELKAHRERQASIEEEKECTFKPRIYSSSFNKNKESATDKKKSVHNYFIANVEALHNAYLRLQNESVELSEEELHFESHLADEIWESLRQNSPEKIADFLDSPETFEFLKNSCKEKLANFSSQRLELISQLSRVCNAYYQLQGECEIYRENLESIAEFDMPALNVLKATEESRAEAAIFRSLKMASVSQKAAHEIHKVLSEKSKNRNHERQTTQKIGLGKFGMKNLFEKNQPDLLSSASQVKPARQNNLEVLTREAVHRQREAAFKQGEILSQVAMQVMQENQKQHPTATLPMRPRNSDTVHRNFLSQQRQHFAKPPMNNLPTTYDAPTAICDNKSWFSKLWNRN